jgi:hypothetical protein
MKSKASEELRAFDDAMGRLLNVSHQELQERLEREREARPKRKKRRTTSTVSSRVASRGKKRSS